jgi:hypothetical protein
MHIDVYVHRMGRRAARAAELGGAALAFRVQSDMCRELAAAHGFTLDEATARAACAFFLRPLLEVASAEERSLPDPERAPEAALRADTSAPPFDRRSAQAGSIASVTYALAGALQAWLRASGFHSRRRWALP